MNPRTGQQAEIRPTAIYFRLGDPIRLRERMEKVGFNPQESLNKLVGAAEIMIHLLSVELHYRS